MPYAMVSDKSLARFRAELAAGKRPKLTRADFTPSPGAHDEMTPELRRKIAMDRRARDQELPAHIGKQLDALSRDSAKQVHDYLRKRLARDVDPGDLDDWQHGPAAGSQDQQEEDDRRLDKLCALMAEAGVSDDKIEKIREWVLAGGADGDLLLRHKGDQGVVGAPGVGYDPLNRPGMDQPPPFRGAPQAPYTSPGDAERHAALENMSRIRSEPGDRVYKDGVPFTGTTPSGDEYIHGARLRRSARDTSTRGGRHGSRLAMDAASAEAFFTRFPDARRLRSL
jgi:hypothetical protein